MHPFLGSLDTKDPSGHALKSSVQLKRPRIGDSVGDIAGSSTETSVWLVITGTVVDIVKVGGSVVGITVVGGGEVGISVVGNEVGISVVGFDVGATVRGLESSSSSQKMSKILSMIEVFSSSSPPPSNKLVGKLDTRAPSLLELTGGSTSAVELREYAREVVRHVARRRAIEENNMVVIDFYDCGGVQWIIDRLCTVFALSSLLLIYDNKLTHFPEWAGVVVHHVRGSSRMLHSWWMSLDHYFISLLLMVSEHF